MTLASWFGLFRTFGEVDSASGNCRCYKRIALLLLRGEFSRIGAVMLLPDPRCLEIDQAVAEKDCVTMVITTKLATAHCPQCDQPSPRVHSRYKRTLADLPWQGIRVYLRLQSRKFFCSNEECRQTIFTERLPTVVQPYARRTLRLDQALR
jgi:transposase